MAVGAAQVRAREVGVLERAALEGGVDELHVGEVGTVEDAAKEVRAGDRRARQIAAREVDGSPLVIGEVEARLAKERAAQRDLVLLALLVLAGELGELLPANLLALLPVGLDPGAMRVEDGLLLGVELRGRDLLLAHDIKMISFRCRRKGLTEPGRRA
jgi:hypothetical protein